MMQFLNLIKYVTYFKGRSQEIKGDGVNIMVQQ